MAKRDYYEVLGVPKNADKNAIKSAYRRLAIQYHPDTNKADDAEERFREVNEAYINLADTEKRKAYDESLRPKMTEGPVLKSPGEYNSPATRSPQKTPGDLAREEHQRLLQKEIELPEDERYLVAGIAKMWKDQGNIQSIEINDKEGKVVWKIEKHGTRDIYIKRRLSDFVASDLEMKAMIRDKEYRVDREATFFTVKQIAELEKTYNWIPDEYARHIGELGLLALQTVNGFRDIQKFLNQEYQTRDFVERNRFSFRVLTPQLCCESN